MILTFLLAMLVAAAAMPLLIWALPGTAEDEDPPIQEPETWKIVDLSELDTIAEPTGLSVPQPETDALDTGHYQAEIEDLADDLSGDAEAIDTEDMAAGLTALLAASETGRRNPGDDVLQRSLSRRA